MTTTTFHGASGTAVPDDAGGVLAFAREQRRVADAAEARLLEAAVQWAVFHPAESVADAETYTFRSGLEGVVPIAGPGAPLVAEFCVAELAAALGLGTEAGKHYLGQAVELRYRLPRLWARVMSGDLAAWKARRVADATIGDDLSAEAAAFVDTHVAPVAHKIRPAQLDRLVEEAVGRFMPEQAEQRRSAGLDRRHFSINRGHVSFGGTTFVEGELDLADALDLDDAIRGLAAQLADLGSTETLDQRRARAAGELARRQLALDLAVGFEAQAAGGLRTSTSDQPDVEVGGTPAMPVVEVRGAPAIPEVEVRGAPARPEVEVRGTPAMPEVEVRGASATSHETPATAKASRPRRRPTSRTVLYLHLTDAALRGAETVGRCETTRSPVAAETIRAWCGRPDTHLVVTPVIDLADHVHTDAYEVPDRITDHVALRDLTCVFPHCTRPARRLRPDEHRCDSDHVTAYRQRPETTTTGVAPLCRHHHRLKTHGGWHYRVLEPGSYLWTSPHHYRYLRDHTGTQPMEQAAPEPDNRDRD